MNGEHFPIVDYVFVYATALAELIVAICIRKAKHASTRAVRNYLILQLAFFPVMYASSLFAHEVYFWAYFVFSLIGEAAILVIIAALHHDLRGKVDCFGSVRAWVASSCLIGIALGYALIIKPPTEKVNFSALLTVDQALSYVNIFCLIGILVYGYIAASSWPKVPMLVWAGLSIYIAADSFNTESALLHHFASAFWSRKIPTVAFLVTLYLWHRAGSASCKQMEI